MEQRASGLIVMCVGVNSTLGQFSTMFYMFTKVARNRNPTFRGSHLRGSSMGRSTGCSEMMCPPWDVELTEFRSLECLTELR